MAYSTLSDWKGLISEASIIQLTDDENINPGVIDGADPDCALILGRTDKARADADATIDAYCQSRYPVPFSPVPEKIRQISGDITVYNLYSRHADMGMPEIRSDRNKEAIRFLEKVSEGKIILSAITPAPAGDTRGACSTANGRIFTRRKMSGF